MNRIVPSALCVVLLSCANPLPVVRAPQPSTSENCLFVEGERCASATLTPGTTFPIDISGLVRHLAPLRRDERADQLADWAFYGTLVHANLPPEVLRGVTYDRAPFRLRALEDVVNLEF